VWLPSGGYLFIEREAMTTVDVNTGKSVGKTNRATVVNSRPRGRATAAARHGIRA
jgi:Ribonuclease G/E